MNTNEAGPLLVSVDEGCAALRLGRVKFYQLLNTREVESIKIGKRRLVVVESLRAFVDRNIAGVGR